MLPPEFGAKLRTRPAQKTPRPFNGGHPLKSTENTKARSVQGSGATFRFAYSKTLTSRLFSVRLSETYSSPSAPILIWFYYNQSKNWCQALFALISLPLMIKEQIVLFRLNRFITEKQKLLLNCRLIILNCNPIYMIFF